MLTLFVGQKGIPVMDSSAAYDRERRVQVLAEFLAAKGNEVIVTCQKNFISKSIQRYKNITLKHSSFMANLWFIARHKPDVVHIHGWKYAAFIWLMALLSPMTKYIWTLDEAPWPRSFVRNFTRFYGVVCDSITVPSRTIQYHVRQMYGIKTTYIPDGYGNQNFVASDISLKHFGLRKGQYCLAIVQSEKQLTWLEQAYYTSRTKKPLVVLRSYRMPGERVMRSLTKYAAAVLAISTQTPLSLLFEAMEAERAIIAINNPVFEEVLGVTAQYISPNDSEGFKDALNTVAVSRKRQFLWGEQAKIRARHFHLDRVLPEYIKLYNAHDTVTIPLDSVISMGSMAGVVKWQTRKV